MGSTRALACADRRLAGRSGRPILSRCGDSFEHAKVIAEGACLFGRQADHGTRGRVRFPRGQGACSVMNPW